MGKTYFKENIMGEKNDVFKIGYANTDIYSVVTDPSYVAVDNVHVAVDNVHKIDYYDKMLIQQPEIKKVIFNDPATIVYWEDRTKTVVKCEKEKYDPEKGLAMAIAKKAMGNQGNYFEVFKKWIGEEKLFPEKKKKKQVPKKKSSKK